MAKVIEINNTCQAIINHTHYRHFYLEHFLPLLWNGMQLFILAPSPKKNGNKNIITFHRYIFLIITEVGSNQSGSSPLAEPREGSRGSGPTKPIVTVAAPSAWGRRRWTL